MDVASTGGNSKRNVLHGPAYVKMLVNNVVAGSIIGKNGSVISHIEQQTGCAMKLSPSNSFFPGTQDRVLVLSGELEQINHAMMVIFEKIHEISENHSNEMAGAMSQLNSASRFSVKVVLPKSAVSAIIGKGGASIKLMQENTGAKIQISNREEGLNERVITLTGSFDQVQNAAQNIASNVQADPNLKDHMYVAYHKYPLGGPGAFGGQHVPTSGVGTMNGFVGHNMAHGGQGGFGGHQYQQQMFPQHNELINHQCEIIVQIADQWVGPVIGKNGVCLSEIINATGARVQISQKGDMIPGTSDRKCTISGSVGAVHTAHVMLLQRMETAMQQNKMQQNNMGSNGASMIQSIQQPCIGDLSINHQMIPGSGGHMNVGNAGAIPNSNINQQFQPPYNMQGGMMHQVGAGGFMQSY